MKYLDEAQSMVSGMNYGQGEGDANAGGFLLSFDIQRTGATIAAQLPVPLFAPNLGTDGYNRYLSGEFAATGHSVTVYSNIFYSNSASNSLLPSYFFTYSDGTNTDDVRIFLPENSYKQFQQNLTVDKFYISELTFVVAATADRAQFNEAIKFKGDSGYGSSAGNSFTPNQFKDSREQDADRVHVNRFGKSIPMPRIDRETGMIVKMRQASFTYTIIVNAARTNRM